MAAAVARSPPPPFRSLSRTLIGLIVTAGALCTITVAALQLAFTYQAQRSNFEGEVQWIARVNVPLLSVNLWDIEPEAIRRQLSLIAERPQIAHVRLEAVTGQIFESGNPVHRGAEDSVVLDIPYPAGQAGRLGTVRLAPNVDHLYTELANDVLRVLAGCALLTALICILVAVILRRQLQLPMQRIAGYAASLTPAQLARPLNLDRPVRRWRDEIDEVADGFRVLQDDLRHHVQHLDEQVSQRTAELQRANLQLESLARRDPLTGLANRRRFDHEKLRAWQQMLSDGQPLSVLMIDVDYFKNYNDTYGHAAGDECLVALARALAESFNRRGELAVRMGGEEFAVLLENMTLDDAVARAELFRNEIVDLKLPHAKSTHGRVTVSVGVSTADLGELFHWLASGAASSGIGALLGRADQALYEAKGAGRNTVVGLALETAATR